MDEIWKPIPGAFGQEVSTEGRMRRTRKSFTNTGFIAIEGFMWQGSLAFNIRLSAHGQRYKNYRVDLAVLTAFVGEKPNGHRIIHKDGNPCNCALSNLEYQPTKTFEKEERIAKKGGWTGYKLTMDDVLVIKQLLAEGFTQRAIAKLFGVHYSYISRIHSKDRAATIDSET